MKLKNKLVIIVLVSVVMLSVAIYFSKDSLGTEKTVKIVDYGSSICTQDMPTSSCGPYNVTAQVVNGEKITYKVAGYSNRDSKLYDEIAAKITMAKEQQTSVTLKVNYKGEIISVQ